MSLAHALRTHYPEYLMEAAGLGTFMASAATFGTLLWHPELPVAGAVGAEWLRLVLMGTAMGATAIGLIYSPWGKRSGAHFNPAVTLAMLRLGKIAPWDALFYIGAQFVGGAAGVLAVTWIAQSFLDAPPLWYVPTVPGRYGVTVALVVEAVMSGGLIAMVLAAAEREPLSRWIGVFAGLFLLVYIAVAAPISGMSINPARTVASALPSGSWEATWIYFVGPIGAMWLVAELFLLVHKRRPECVGMNNQARDNRVFRCGRDYWAEANG